MQSDDLAIRLSRLEERLAWFERHSTEQDKVTLELADRLRALERRLETLEHSGAPVRANALEDSVDEKPPHY